MTDKRDVKPEIVEIKGVLQKITPHQNLVVVKTNRWLLVGLISLMTASVIAGYTLAPDTDIKIKKTAPAVVYSTEMNPVTSPEINKLKGQFVGLISGSIESKLKTLEKNIRTGAIASSLGTIQDLRDDVKVLQAYSKPEKQQSNTGNSVSNEQLLREVSHLRNLIYLTLSSCGLLVAGIAGVWFKKRRQLPYKKESLAHYLGKD